MSRQKYSKIPNNRSDLEANKFTPDSNDDVNVRVLDADGHVILQDILIALGGGTIVNTYDTASSVASGVPTTVVTFTVPIGKTFDVKLVEFSSTNIAEYNVDIDSSIEATRRTNFGADLSGEFKFEGLSLAQGSVIKLIAEHSRGGIADFEARILGVLK